MATDTIPASLMAQRAQLSQAVLSGYYDASLAAAISTAKTNGYAAGKIDKTIHVISTSIDGVNR